MDDVTSAAGAGAAPATTAGGDGGGTSTAAPSSTSTAAPASTPAPVSTPSTESAAPTEPVAPSRNVGETDAAYVERFLKWREEEKAKASGDKPTSQTVKPAEPVKPVEAAKPAEPAKPAEQKVEPVKAAEPEKNPLDDIGPLPASKFAEALKTNPALEAELEKAGIDKEELFNGLREAATATQFRELFTDVETARFAHQAAETLQGMDLAATNLKPGDLESTQDFIQNVLMPMSYLLDDEGKPKMREIKRADGSVLTVPETDGTVQTFLENVRDVAFEQIIADANHLLGQKNERARELGERLLAATQEIQEFCKGVDLNADGMSEEVKAERARLEADRAAFADTKRKEADQRFETFRNDVTNETNSVIDGMVNDFLSKTSLLDDPNDSQQVKESKAFVRNGVLREIRDGLFARFNSNKLFIAEMEQIGRRGPSASTQQALVNLYKRQANAVMEKVAAPILAKAGAVRVQASKARAAKVDAQIKASQTEPRGSVSPSIPSTPQVDQKALANEAFAQLRGELRRMPTAGEIMDRTRQLIAKAGKAAATA